MAGVAMRGSVFPRTVAWIYRRALPVEHICIATHSLPISLARAAAILAVPASPTQTTHTSTSSRGSSIARTPEAARGFAASAAENMQNSIDEAIDTYLPVKTLPKYQGTRRNLETVVRNMNGEVVGTTTLLGDVFDLPIRSDIVHEVVVWQLAARRQGTHKTKGRGEVHRTGRKPHPQKGTGRARAGDLAAPHHSGGGHAHPIRPRDYSYKINKKVMRLALCCTLSARAAEGSLMVVDKLELDEPKTRWVHKKLQTLLGEESETGEKRDKDYPRVLVVDKYEDDLLFQLFVRATKNMRDVEVLSEPTLNVYSILHRRKLIITVDALEQLQERLTAPILRIKAD